MFYIFTRQTFSRKKPEDDQEQDLKKPHQSKLDAKFFSFTTFYYLVGIGCFFFNLHDCSNTT